MRYVIVCFIVLATIAAPSPSIEGADICCVHECCASTYNSRPVQRLAARLRLSLAGRLGVVLALLNGPAERPAPARLASPLSIAATLRI